MGAVLFAVYNIAELIRRNRLESRYTPQGQVNLTEDPSLPDNHSPPEPGASLRVAVAPVISPEKSLPKYRNLVVYLAGKLGKEPDCLQGKSYEQVNDLVRNRQCHLAMVCTYAFVLCEEEFGMEAIAVPLIDGKDHYHSYIVVPKSSQATSLLDLRGKRFGSANRLSNSGWLYPMVWLQRNGEDPKTFFQGNHVITGSHDRSVSQVVSEDVYGAAVDSLVYDQMVAEDPSIAEKTRIIDESPEFGMPPLVVPPQTSPELKKELTEALLNVHLDPEGGEILKSLQIDRFVRPREGLFDSVRADSSYLEEHQ